MKELEAVQCARRLAEKFRHPEHCIGVILNDPAMIEKYNTDENEEWMVVIGANVNDEDPILIFEMA